MLPRSIKENFQKIDRVLESSDKKFIVWMLLLSLFVSLVEAVGISVIMPFIAVASNFALIKTNQYYNFFFNYFGFQSETNFIIFFGIVLILFFILRGLLNLFHFYILARFSQYGYHRLSVRLFEKYLGISYRNFIEKNSSELMRGLVTEASLFMGVVQAVVFIISEFFVVICIYSVMIYVNLKVTLALTFFLILAGIFLMKFLARKMKIEGDKRAGFQKFYYEIINSTLGNFKLVKLMSHGDKVLERFKTISHGFARSNIVSSVIGHAPRLFLETSAFSLVAVTVIFIVWKLESDVVAYLPTISVFVLGLYRMMPSANRIMNSYNSIVYHMPAVNLIYNQLHWPSEDLGQTNVHFKEKIRLENICFSYIPGREVLSNVNLVINKGDKIAFVGESGSGKSTVVDIIIGLYRPREGKLFIDGEELKDENLKLYRRKVGYIPQTVYLFDGTVAENVAFDSEIDEKKVRDALMKANILDFLETHQDGINTSVGEGGISLSGGQKQRIAIARALYTDPEILVLDEATSALDSETEVKIMDEIYNLSEDKTLIIIAHRLSTISRCDKKYLIKDKKIEEIK